MSTWTLVMAATTGVLSHSMYVKISIGRVVLPGTERKSAMYTSPNETM